ncbi:MAG TPA: hypothetical protein DCR24_03480 [Bacillus bacterium]|nr:hypothetical protein [Bacillus sp. (in: firmicutes)]
MKGQKRYENKMKDYLAVRVLTPGKLFAFWQVNEDKLQFICKYFNIPNGRAVKSLRLYDITPNNLEVAKAGCIHEVVLRPEDSSWLFKGISPSRDYVVELGIMRTEQCFFPVLQSNKMISQVKPKDSAAVGSLYLPPDWTNQVSTYTYYENVEGSSKK